MAKKTIKTIIYLFLLIGGSILSVRFVRAEEKDPIEEIKNSIIEIQAGLTLSDGKFYPVKNASGCLISNDSNGVYVVTANHSVVISEKEKKRFCKKKKISTDNYNINKAVRLVVKGDVTAEASILASSDKYDFCVLDIGNVLQEKQALRIGSVGDVNIGDTIYALGFPEEAQNGGKLQYTAGEVEIHSGEIQDTSAWIDNRGYLQHSAIVTPNNSGGALISRDGYLIGMNNAAIVNKDTAAFYALPVGEIREILDNYGIFYYSRDKDTAYRKLQETYAKYEKLAASKSYKAETTDVLSATLQEVNPLLAEEHLDMDTIVGAQKKLDAARQQLKRKMPKTKIVIIVLGILCLLVFIRFMYLIIWWHRAKKNASTVDLTYQGTENAPDDASVSGSEMNVEPSHGYGANEAGYRGQIFDAASEVTVPLMWQDENETVILRNYAGSNDAGFAEEAFHNRKDIARLLCERTRQLITIGKAEYTIGKSSEAVDFAITDNPAISRKHASVRWKNDAYYLFDLNSANGTFVNGRKIDGTGIKLTNHDKVVLADEAFEFKLE